MGPEDKETAKAFTDELEKRHKENQEQLQALENKLIKDVERICKEKDEVIRQKDIIIAETSDTNQYNKNMADIAAHIKPKAVKVREPIKFSQPTRGLTTERWLKDYVRYIKCQYPGESHPLHITIALYLEGPAFEWYAAQSHETQDSFEMIKAGLIAHFKDKERSFKRQRLTPFDSQNHTMEDWITEVDPYFNETSNTSSLTKPHNIQPSDSPV